MALKIYYRSNGQRCERRAKEARDVTGIVTEIEATGGQHIRVGKRFGEAVTFSRWASEFAASPLLIRRSL